MSLKTLTVENIGLKNKLHVYTEAHQKHDTIQLITECRMKSKKREQAKDEKADDV